MHDVAPQSQPLSLQSNEQRGVTQQRRHLAAQAIYHMLFQSAINRYTQGAICVPERPLRYQRTYMIDDFVQTPSIVEYKLRVHEYFHSAARMPQTPIGTASVSLQRNGDTSPRALPTPPLLTHCVVTIRDRFDSEFMLLPVDRCATGAPRCMAGFIWIPNITVNSCGGRGGRVDEEVTAYLRRRLLEFAAETARRITLAIGSPIDWLIVGNLPNRSGGRVKTNDINNDFTTRAVTIARVERDRLDSTIVPENQIGASFARES